MKLFRMLRKPAWESRDAQERALAVAESQETELLARLADFARSDDSPLVRKAASRRLRDLSLLGDRAQHDTDANVRTAARERLKALLAGSDDPIALGERERFMRVQDDADLLNHVAINAPEPELRRTALARIQRGGFLMERCQRDPDPGVRDWLLERMDIATLERIAESARKTDKRLARLAGERANTLRLAAGDPTALRTRALALGDELDALRRARPDDMQERLTKLDAEWTELRARVPAEIGVRVDGYRDALRNTLTALAPPAPIVETVVETPVETHAEPIAALDATVAISMENLAAFTAEASATPIEHQEVVAAADATASAPTESVAAETQASVEPAAAKPPKAVSRIDWNARTATLDALEQALERNHLGDSRRFHAALRDGNEAGRKHAPPRFNARVADAEERLEKLIQWQRWSNSKLRARLCDEIEALLGSGLHPDGLAAKIKDAQQEWERLDRSERAPGDDDAKIESGLSRRFRGLCHRALAPARPYFEKRGELREQRATLAHSVLDEVEQGLAQGADSRSLSLLRRRVGDWLRRLDEIDPRQRGATGKRLRDALTRIEAAQLEQQAGVQAEKHKLIANLRRKLVQSDLAAALDLCKDAQARWQRLPRGDRKTEDALWTEFRELTDPWFEKAKGERTAQDQARQQAETEAQAVLDELNTLATADDEELKHAESRVAALTARWRALQPAEVEAERPRDDRGARGRGERGERNDRDRGDRQKRRDHPREREFDRGVAKVQEAQTAQQSRREQSRREAMFAAAAICAELEDVIGARLSGAADTAMVEDAQARFAAVALTGSAAGNLRQRYQLAVEWLTAAPEPQAWASLQAETETQAALLAVRAEFAAGIESPEVWRGLRREYQVQRLAERMGRGVAASAPADGDAILAEWCGLGPMAVDTRAGFGARVAQALAGLTRT